MKQRDSLKGSLVWVLLAAELEFPKILVPRLPQTHQMWTLKVLENQTNYFAYVTYFLEPWYISILLFSY